MSGKKISTQQSYTTYEFPARKAKQKKTLGQLIYDGEKGRILGRTPKNWAQLIIFYTVFYAVLAALFTICLQALFFTLNDEHPKWQLEESLIGVNPGLGFRPLPDDPDEGSLVWYEAKNQTQVKVWTDRLDKFLEPYRNKSLLPSEGKNQVVCDFDQSPKEGQVCSVEVDSWGPCSPSEGYSYNKSSPCIFLKLNRIYGWEPEFYTEPIDEMPQQLKDFINAQPMEKRKQIWVSCDGQDPVDMETLSAGLEYYPKDLHGFPGYFYPYVNTPGYLSPLVAVRLLRPQVHQIVNIECKAWAKNIKVQLGRDRSGSVHFEVMVD
ncbi:sodium/potassium-transporting ATPase subunit beta-2-like isoform X2 [Culicoides brevitarsis]|uniref:sodium/potassium-transporting ATPase subunit beta-2-like isoform X2 n=1 Tax=Culicoides brevitarsis TaxID=469753 RepID=UPI00307BFD42